ncbi:MAG: YceI family protein [Candidatus Nanopelagicales bacterium]
MDITTEHGRLTLHTAVAGAAARMGHNLVIVIDDWSMSVELAGAAPTSLALRADLTSLRVESGSGGVKPVGDGDRRTIRDNALKSLHADRHPEITFVADTLTRESNDLHATGTLTINGTSQPLTATAALEESADRVTARCTVPVRQSDFGVRPYSAMMGQLKVADEVQVSVEVTAPLP